MRPRPLLALPLLLGGCVYLNTLYNARTAYDTAERARLVGQAQEAREGYRSARDKAAASFRKDSLGGWGHASLLLLGQAHFRLGALEESQAALGRVIDEAPDPALRQEARVFLGAALVAAGEYRPGVAVLNEALREEAVRGRLRGEGHMWRGRALLAMGRVDEGWWDLARAVEADAGLEAPGHLERLRWAIQRDDRPRAREGAAALLQDADASIWVDSVARLVDQARTRWSPQAAAELLSRARGAPWSAGAQNRLLLQRIDLLLESGDTLAAETELGWVAQGAGPDAIPARLALAEIRLRRLQSVDELDQVRRVLLPAAREPRAVPALEDLRVLELLAEVGEPAFASLFAAAEMARERLRSPALARGLFLAAATAEDGGAWRGKAALAARDLAPDAPDTRDVVRDLLRDRDPYLARAWNRYLPTDTLHRLDAALERQLDQVRSWALEEARRRDVLVRERTGREPESEPEATP